ncbi:MAG: putative membrane protein [Rhodothermales bacterium]
MSCHFSHNRQRLRTGVRQFQDRQYFGGNLNPNNNGKFVKKMLIPILFAIGTACLWGMYGPTIGNAQIKMPPPEGWSPFKPYVFIGVAYLVFAIGGGLIAMMLKGDTFSYTGGHFAPAKWGFLAGSLGAGGALCLTSAMMISRGNALLVMPIVFGGAVSVTAIYSAWKLRGHATISPMLWVGVVMVVVGVVIVARNTPHGHAPKPSTEHAELPQGSGETSPKSQH